MIEVNIVIFLVISKYAYKIFKNWKKKEKRKRNTKYTSRSSIIFRWLKKLNFQNRKSNKNFSPPIFFFFIREKQYRFIEWKKRRMKFIWMKLTKTDTEMAIRLSKIYSQMKYRRVEDLVKQAASKSFCINVQNEVHTTIQTFRIHTLHQPWMFAINFIHFYERSFIFH